MVVFRISELAKPYMEYDMINQHTELPLFPELRAKLLFLFLNYPQQQENSEICTLAASLVQLGLDTHNLVTATNSQKEKTVTRGRQLKVLAGDYFSSRFYELLAQAGQITIIKQLAAAICDVNRMKLNLYLLVKQLKVTAVEYLESSVNINIQLFLSFKSSLAEALQPMWPAILRGFNLCEMLVEEIGQNESSVNFNQSWSFWHIMQSATKDEQNHLHSTEPDKQRQMNLKYQTKSLLVTMLEEEVKQILQNIKLLCSEKLQDELEILTEPFRQFLNKHSNFQGLTR